MTVQEKHEAIEAANQAGIDVSLLDSNLALTPEERALRHESALELALALRAAGLAHAKSQTLNPTTR